MAMAPSPRGWSQWLGWVQPAGLLPRSQGSQVPVEVLRSRCRVGAVASSRASWPGSQPLTGSVDFPILFLLESRHFHTQQFSGC